MCIFKMGSVLYVIFGRNQSKNYVGEEETEKIRYLIRDHKQRFKESLNENQKPSKESNLELIMTLKNIIPHKKLKQEFEKL